MTRWTEILGDAGIFAYPVLLVSGLGFLVSLWFLSRMARGRGVFTTAWVAAPGLGLLVGLLGTTAGLGQTERAAGYASPDVQAALVAQGIAVSLYTTIIGASLAVVGLIFAAGSSSLGQILGAGPRARHSPIHAAAPLVAGTLGGAGLYLWLDAPTAAAVTGIGTLAIAVTSLRAGGAGGLEDADRRLAAGRVNTTVLAVGASAALALSLLCQTIARYFEAYGHASVLTEMDRVERQAATLSTEATGAVASAALLVLVGILALVPVYKHLVHRRAAFDGLAIGLLFAVLTAMTTYVGSRVEQLGEHARPWQMIRAEDLAAMELELPRSTSTRPPHRGITVTLTDQSIRLDDATIRSGSDTAVHQAVLEALEERQPPALPSHISLESDGTRTIGQLRPVLTAATAAGMSSVDIRTLGPRGGLGSVTAVLGTDPHAAVRNDSPGERFVSLLPDPDAAPPVELALAARGEALVFEDQPVVDSTEVAKRFLAITDGHPGQNVLVLHLDDTVTLQQLVSWLEIARAGPDSVPFPVVQLRFGALPARGPSN